LLRRNKTKNDRRRATRLAQEAVDKILLLNWRMPNDVPVRRCKGTYVAKVCGPLAKAGKKAGNKLMGEVFDENGLREFVGWVD
jgi:hypothetical protein